ncbi:MAG: AAA family ATPase [Candidatus Aegiribacteria sp.]|nr:AAA family ATPase [Candidatus Aegiribacteria sp.]
MRQLAPFTGRRQELELLNQQLDEALNYSGGFVLVKGEIGVGKTWLLNRFRGRIEERDLHILHGRVIKDDVKPFSPFTQMIKYYLCDLEHNQSWLLKYLSPEIAPHFAHLIPDLRNYYPVNLPDLAHPVDNTSFLYSFQRFFEDLSKSKPLVLILDDIQWMSDESVQLLNYLVQRIIEQSILIVGTARSEIDNPVLKGIIDEFNTDRLVININLSNFSRKETETYLCGQFEGGLPNHFTNWLFAITKGNPLFIEEILKALIRQNIIHQDKAGKGWQTENDYKDFTITETVDSVIHYRLGSLAADEMNMLQGAAVIGERFSPELLRKLFDTVPDEQFHRSNSILIASGMITEPDDMQQFAHPLIHTLHYRRISISRRRGLHRKLAGILRECNRSDEEILFHMIKDLLPSEETEELACHLYKVSMALMLSSYQYPIAWEYLSIAGAIADKIPLQEKYRLKIRAEFNYLSWKMGRDCLSSEESEHLVTGLIHNDLNKEAALTYRILFHKALITQDIEKAEEFYEKGLSLLKTDDSFYWSFVVEHCLLQRRKELLEESEQEAMKLTAEIPENRAPEALYKVYTNLGLVSYLKGDADKAHQYLTRARKIVDLQHLLHHVGDSSSNLGLIEMAMGRLDSALKRFNDSIKEAELLRLEPLIGINLLYIGSYFRYKGEYKQSLSFFDQTLEKAADINNPRLKLSAQIGKAKTLLKLGDIETAESILRGIPEDRISKQMHYDIQIMESHIHLKRNELEAAEELIDRVLKQSKELHSEMRYGIALGAKALILLHRDMQPEALRNLEDSRSKLIAKGEMPYMSEILIDFGLAMGGVQGETIFMEGLEILSIMQATAVIARLYDVVKKKDGFGNAAELISEMMDDISVNRIEVSTFGGLAVKRPGDTDVVANREWKTRKSQELLALILVQSGSRGTTREILASHLWPETTKKKSLRNLRVALSNLNKVMGSQAILQEGSFLAFDRELVRADLWTFESLVKEWRTFKQSGKFHPAEDRARRAVSLYKGYFLPEFYSLPVADKQDELKNTMREMLFWLAIRCIDRVEWHESILLAKRLLLLDACNEQACRIIMHGLHNQGDRTGAIRQFEHLCQCLKAEFDTVPGPETVKLYDRITSSN